MAQIGMRKTVQGSYDEVLARLPEVLKAQGFGVLTRIDVKQTLKEKIGADFRRYQILGACNPRFAHQALLADPAIGSLLPCSVAVWEEDDGRVTVNAVEPPQSKSVTNWNIVIVATVVPGENRLILTWNRNKDENTVSHEVRYAVSLQGFNPGKQDRHVSRQTTCHHSIDCNLLNCSFTAPGY